MQETRLSIASEGKVHITPETARLSRFGFKDNIFFVWITLRVTKCHTPTVCNHRADVYFVLLTSSAFILSFTVLPHPEDQHFLSGSMKSRCGSRVGDSRSFLDMFSYHKFRPDRKTSFLKFLRIEVSDGSRGFLSSGSPFGSNSPDD